MSASKYKPMGDKEWLEFSNSINQVDVDFTVHHQEQKLIEQAVIDRIWQQGLVIVPKEFLAWMPDGIDDSMPVTLYAQQLNKGGA